VRWIGDGNYQQVDIPADDRIDNIAEALRSIDSDHDCDVIVTMSKNLLFEVASLRAIRSMMERTVLDPVQGSYYLEKLMTEIIDKTNL